MGFIPSTTCRRCARTYPSVRSRCPYCGTERVKSSDRTPATSYSRNVGTNAQARAEQNAKWQGIFSAVLLAAVILAVIILVSSNLNAGVLSTPTPTLPAVTVTPTATPAPTATPEPTPAVTGIQIFSYGSEVYDFTCSVGDTVTLSAQAYPYTVVPDFVWTSSDTSV